MTADSGSAVNVPGSAGQPPMRSEETLHAASPVLRDRLAASRTRLANERTLLAYVRTALGFLATGVGLFYLFDTRIFQVVAAVLTAASAATLAIGVARYRAVARDVAVFEAGIERRDGRSPAGGTPE